MLAPPTAPPDWGRAHVVPGPRRSALRACGWRAASPVPARGTRHMWVLHRPPVSPLHRLLLLSTTASYAIASHKSYSHILQFTVCMGHLYGGLVYFITAYLDGFNFWISPFYFWAYFIGANSFWVWIPTLIAMRSWKMICAAFRAS